MVRPLVLRVPDRKGGSRGNEPLAGLAQPTLESAGSPREKKMCATVSIGENFEAPMRGQSDPRVHDFPWNRKLKTETTGRLVSSTGSDPRG